MTNLRSQLQVVANSGDATTSIDSPSTIGNAQENTQ